MSLFEMAIKFKINKLRIKNNLSEFIEKVKSENVLMLPINESHLTAYNDVPLMDDHRDPFDRMIIANALAESMPVITIDKQFDHYKGLIQIIW